MPLRRFSLRLVTDPDVGADTGVVEHLLWQGDDGLEPVVLDDPLADVALARARAAGKEGRAAEDDGEPRAVLVFRRPARVLACPTCAAGTAANRRSRAAGPAPKRPSKPRLSCSCLISFCCFFQSTPKGGLVMK